MGSGNTIQSIHRVPYRFCPLPCSITDDWLHQLSGSELKTYIAITRLTWGRRKPFDTLSITQISKITGLGRFTTSHSTASLQKRGLLKITGDTRHARTYEVLMARFPIAQESNAATPCVAQESNTVLLQRATSIDSIDRADRKQRAAR